MEGARLLEPEELERIERDFAGGLPAREIVEIFRPRGVQLSEATFRKVQSDVAAVPLPPIRVKGKADELRVFNAVGLRNRTFPAENTRPG